MAQDLGTFALRLLEIARTSTSLTFEDMYAEFKALYGAIPWSEFSSNVTASYEAGYIGLSGGTFPGSPESEFAVEIRVQGARATAYRQLFTQIDKGSISTGIEKLKTELGVDLLRNANRDLFDAMLRHQIQLLKMDRTISADIMAILDKTEVDIAKQIVKRLGEGGRSLLGTNRLKLLQDFIKNTRLEAWDQVDEKWISDLVEVAKNETKVAKGITEGAAPVTFNLVLPPVNTLKAIVKTKPFEGRVMGEWSRKIAEADIQRMMDQINIGLVQGESGDAIASRIVGTARLRGMDGVTQITRNNAEAITRTAVNAITGAAREEFYNENPDVFGNERFVATLDGRTTPTCRANDGKIFERGSGPQPPLHFNCRSVRIPYFGEDALFQRPARAFTEKTLLRQFAEQEGLDYVPATRNSLPYGMKGAYDTFAQGQMRKLTSVIPGNETYQTWLMRQPKDFQVDVLGKTRAMLFRQGGLTLDKFVDTSGRNYNIKELAQKYHDAFAKAGLSTSGLDEVFKSYDFATASQLKVNISRALTEAEAKAANDYSKVSHVAINTYARTGVIDDWSTKAELEEYIKHLDSAIARSSLGESIIANRQMSGSRTWDNLIKGGLKVGDVVGDLGYSSFTVANSGMDFADWRNRGGVRLEIQMPKGTKGLWLGGEKYGNKYVANWRDEYELLLARNSQFKVTSIEQLRSGGYVIRGSLV